MCPSGHSGLSSEYRLPLLEARRVSVELAKRLAAGASATLVLQFEQNAGFPHSGTLIAFYRDGIRCALSLVVAHFSGSLVVGARR